MAELEHSYRDNMFSALFNLSVCHLVKDLSVHSFVLILP